MTVLPVTGSSPRVRGKGRAGRHCRIRGGIIPAGAGKRRKIMKKIFLSRDHPRGCGEKRKAAGKQEVPKGSSPRVRGKAETVPRLLEGRGIIPAGAGKSVRRSSLGTGQRDHPRGCGEKPHVELPIVGVVGSSPRVRGKVAQWLLAGAAAGIIPAGAGKRVVCLPASIASGDHPRGCGEKTNARWIPARRMGSSPRVRGKVVGRYFGCKKSGIIPAGAGKRALSSERQKGRRDHPRGCGEKSRQKAAFHLLSGSSPRVRGKGARKR